RENGWRGRARSIGEIPGYVGGAGWSAGAAGGGCDSRRWRRSPSAFSCFWSCSISLRSASASCAAAGAHVKATHIRANSGTWTRMTILRLREFDGRAGELSRRGARSYGDGRRRLTERWRARGGEPERCAGGTGAGQRECQDQRELERHDGRRVRLGCGGPERRHEAQVVLFVPEPELARGVQVGQDRACEHERRETQQQREGATRRRDG